MAAFHQVVTKLIDYCESHAMIEQVYYEDEYELEGNTKANYPAVIIERSPSSMNVGSNTFSLSVAVVDMALPSERDNIQIDSKCYEIMSDIRAYLSKGIGSDYFVDNPLSSEPINREMNDRVRGWRTDIDIVTSGNASGCEYPGNE